MKNIPELFYQINKYLDKLQKQVCELDCNLDIMKRIKFFQELQRFQDLVKEIHIRY